MKKPKLHVRLFGTFKTDSLHLLLVGNCISLAPGLVTLATTGWPGSWLGWIAKIFQVLAVALFGSLILQELLEYRTRPDRRRFWDVPWPEIK
jgi:hypothetical protein